MRAAQLIEVLEICGKPPAFKDFSVRGLSCDSRSISRDYIFVAVKGTRQDGAKYIKEAAERGARIAVVQPPFSRRGLPQGLPVVAVRDCRRASAELAAEFYRQPSVRLKVVGITGTNGKTTTAYLIEALLKKSGGAPAVLGTVNYRFGNRVIASSNTTPGPVQLQAFLRGMADKGADFAVMEVSSHALDQQRTHGVRFHSAVFTNLTQDHLDYHKDMQDYFRAKARLFSGLGPCAFAVINSDDKYGRRLETITRAGVITYGTGARAEVCAREIKLGPAGAKFILAMPGKRIRINSNLIGMHNVYNILAAAAWGFGAGIKPEVIGSVLCSRISLPGRLERIACGKRFCVFVDYAHTPDALRNIITALKQICAGKLIVVFGCGGERDRAKRPLMGKIATELSDYAIITEDNPRSEDPRRIFREIEKGISGRNYSVIAERRGAIIKSLALAGQGDIVLIAGKGHETYQVLKNRVIHFDDREVVRECLRRMN